jgi:hypothetical protein
MIESIPLLNLSRFSLCSVYRDAYAKEACTGLGMVNRSWIRPGKAFLLSQSNQEEDLERFGSDSVLISFVLFSYSHTFRWSTTNKK